MASSATAGRHVVAVPYPGSGHINPMLAVCRLLVAADGALTVIVVVTEEWHALLASAPTLPDRVRFATIPNDVIPPERSRGVDHAAFFEAVSNKMADAVAQLLDRLVLELEPRPEAILVDTYLTWGVAVGARRCIPVCSLWTQPATFFLALYHLDLWPSGDDDHEHDEELSAKSMDQYVPCLSSVRMSDLMVFSRWKRHMKITAEAFVNVRKAQCLLLTSFHELEPCAINTTAELLTFPIYPIGPAHMPPDGNAGRIQDEEHHDWLDAQPEKSVMYVSFGSYASMPHSQFEEIAMGLLDAGVKFFWVARDKAPELRGMCGDRGLAVPWCDQQRVLCHRSVGGFLSHCGWNSVLEAVWAGVPVLAFPVAWDQLVNARMVGDEWKVGVDLREQRGEDGIVSRAAISDAARKLMDSDSGVGQEMRKRAAQLREVSRSAVGEGGSSHSSLSGFLKDLAEGRLEVAESSQ
ncbi:UDP-glycosyltransferase 87A1-like [Triticum dicoccoides]|uniref:UDP-glycosyltransferase 87A1-like n=1 Tax=Triticum dicoccoides TaxID=85692 RepID=UPI00188E9A8E|nr:UDP-glycosyltransferase 87A1-like [Triticum dicoccoides]